MDAKGMEELPVIMMLLEVRANAGQKIGTLIDQASDHHPQISKQIKSKE